AQQYHRSRCGYHARLMKPVKSNPSMPPQSEPVFLRRSRAVVKWLLQASARIGRSQVGPLRAPPDPAMASVHSSARYSRLPPAQRQRCPRPQSARRMRRVFGRRENARRKKRGGSLMPVAPTPRLQIRQQIPSPSSPRARATHGDRDSSGGSFRKLKRAQTRPAVQHWPRRLRPGSPAPLNRYVDKASSQVRKQKFGSGNIKSQVKKRTNRVTGIKRANVH